MEKPTGIAFVLGFARANGWASPAAAGLVLVGFLFFLLASVSEKSPTMDELGHVTAGYAYAKFGDFRLDPENGNLIQRWLALPLLWGDYNFPSHDSVAWRNADLWVLSYDWFYRSGNDANEMLGRSRVMAGLLSVALGALVWYQARRLFGASGGMIALLLFVLSPIVLGNGALSTSDTAVALAFLASAVSLWRLLHAFTVPRLLLSAVAIGGLFLTKFSAVLIIPIAGLLVLVRLFDGRPLPFFGRSLVGRSSCATAFLAGAVFHVIVALGIVWACYGFRYAASGGERADYRFYFPWEWVLEKPDPIAVLNRLELTPAQTEKVSAVLQSHLALKAQWSNDTLDALQAIRSTVLSASQVGKLEELRRAPPPRTIARWVDWIRSHRLLPESFLYGCAHVARLSEERGSFLNGQLLPGGSPWFFPFTFLVKTPLVILLLMAAVVAGFALAVGRGRPCDSRSVLLQGAYASAPFLALTLVYWTAAVMSQTNIGHRHLLPAYPPMLVLCGVVGRWLNSAAAGPFQSARTRRVALSGLFVVLGAEIMFRFPNYLSYFNGIISPSRAYRHLVDSSLDWGQDLPAVARYVRTLAPDTPGYLAYFGIGNPRFYGIGIPQVYAYPGYEYASRPLMKVVVGGTQRSDDPTALAFLRENPDYDPALGIGVEIASRPGVMFLRKPGELRLTGGLYLISASLTQPLHFRNAPGRWSSLHEQTYQRLRTEMQPFLSDDTSGRSAAFKRFAIMEWQAKALDFAEFRFARLAAYLRRREPIDTVNHSVLVYRLTNAEVEEAIHGPPPLEVP